MNDDALLECPICESDSLERVLTCPIVFVKAGDSDIKTVGQLAERNSAKSKYKTEEIREKQAKSYNRGRMVKQEDIDRKKLYKRIAKLDESKREKYIHTGELPPE